MLGMFPKKEEDMIVTKFGGTSLASAASIRKAVNIVKSDPERRFMVVSAPGKRFPEDTKITDLLYQVHHARKEGKDYQKPLHQIREHFREIIEELGISFDLDREINIIEKEMKEYETADYLASRGEYLNARIISRFLDWPFVDAGLLIRFRGRRLDEEATYPLVRSILKNMEHAVIPGFYGKDEEGRITVFSRGGSDVTGAIIARGVKADLYENWTDVSGIMSADPRIVENPRKVDWISYRELREMSYMGASVLHEEAVFPIRAAGIPIQIRNTMDPEAAGTRIVPVIPKEARPHTITGIAGKKGLSDLFIEKAMMNAEVGFGARVMNIIARNGVPYEHTPTSIDSMSVIVETAALEHCRNQIISEIDRELNPDRVMIEDGIALIAVVGEGLWQNIGFASRMFAILAKEGIHVRMIDAGFSEMNVIIGISAPQYEKAFRALYDGLQDLM